MSTLRASNIYDKDGGSNAVLYGVAAPTGSMGFRNRIINGDMRIDQRNAGASVTQNTSQQFVTDRWSIYGTAASKFTGQRNAGSVTPPAGFTNYLGITSSSAYSVASGDVFGIFQRIEGLNTADLGWGAAGAATVTLSFWVRSSLTGTFGGALQNNAQNRNYPFTFTISAANTWEQKTVTIAGDTTGTWATDTSTGIGLYFGLGAGSTFSGTAGAWAAGNIWTATGATSVVGTNGATFYITGVQLEAGSVASPFERRDYGRELMMCQRYLPAWNGTQPIASAFFYGTTDVGTNIPLPVTTRVAPTGVTISSASHFRFDTSASFTPSSISFNSAGVNNALLIATVSGATNNAAGRFLANNASAQLLFTGCEL